MRRKRKIEPLYLALGSNLGDRRRLILDAVTALSRHLGPLRASSLYRSTPEAGGSAQRDYFNAVVVARIDPAEWPAEEVLELGKELERRAGREPGPRHAPRPLDVDLAIYGERVIDRPGLTVPHPQLRRRRFVLTPLLDLEPEIVLPPDGVSARAILDALPPDERLQRLGWN